MHFVYLVTMNKRFFLVVCSLLVLYNCSMAQRRMKQMDADKQAQQDEIKSYERKTWQEKMVYGGNFWLLFGSSYSQLYIQPLVGYKITEKFIAGGGFTYIYWKQQYSNGNNQTLSISDNIYGFNLFARHTLFGPVFAHAEYQPMNFTSHNWLFESKRVWTNALYLGGGINQSFGKSGSGAYFMMLYDVLWQDRDPNNPAAFDRSFRASPFDFRIGVLF